MWISSQKKLLCRANKNFFEIFLHTTLVRIRVAVGERAPYKMSYVSATAGHANTHAQSIV